MIFCNMSPDTSISQHAYLCLELDEKSQDLFVIITPFGKYKCKCLPMGLKCAPNFAQQVMEWVLFGLDSVKVYLNYIGLLQKLGRTSPPNRQSLILTWRKCLHNSPHQIWMGYPRTYWLGYWLTPTGLKPCHTFLSSLSKNHHATSRKCVISLVLSIPISSCCQMGSFAATSFWQIW